jgi:hypothetical protein
MSQTFVFEELDAATRDYLTAVRDAGGRGAPGVFAPTADQLAGCGYVAGPALIVLTLLLTLTTWVDLVYKDPARVAMLQTAGLLLGGWLLAASLRSAAAKGSTRVAGNWVYADPLHLYEAFREQVRVTPIGDVGGANYTHHYNNGAYQHSVVRAVRPDGSAVAFRINDEKRAEQFVVFLDYLAWARGPEGGGIGTLAPVNLGGLARYVAEHDAVPRDHEGNLNPGLLGLTVTAVPEEPAREGRALPSLLPYIVLVAAGFGIFFLMRDVVNPPLRDDALFALVTTEPCEPWFLQMYLLDDRNRAHRPQVEQRLAKEYDELIGRLRLPPGQPAPLRNGMIKVLESLKETSRPIVSLTVTEAAPKPGAEKRVEKLRDELVGKVEGKQADGSDSEEPDFFVAAGGIVGEFARLMPPVREPPGVTFPVPRTARGIQLIEFAAKPEDAPHAHFEITYEFAPRGEGKGDRQVYELQAKVEIRTKLEAGPVAEYEYTSDNLFPARDFDKEAEKLKNRLLAALVGAGGQPGKG